MVGGLANNVCGTKQQRSASEIQNCEAGQNETEVKECLLRRECLRFEVRPTLQKTNLVIRVVE